MALCDKCGDVVLEKDIAPVCVRSAYGTFPPQYQEHCAQCRGVEKESDE